MHSQQLFVMTNLFAHFASNLHVLIPSMHVSYVFFDPVKGRIFGWAQTATRPSLRQLNLCYICKGQIYRTCTRLLIGTWNARVSYDQKNKIYSFIGGLCKLTVTFENPKSKSFHIDQIPNITFNMKSNNITPHQNSSKRLLYQNRLSCHKYWLHWIHPLCDASVWDGFESYRHCWRNL